MRWFGWFREKPQYKSPEYFHTDYPPLDAEEGDQWHAPMYAVTPYMQVGDIYIFTNGDWKRFSQGRHDDFPWKHKVW
jgi:hypothetical protein